MQEFRIVKQVGNAKPYSLYNFKNFNDCYMHLIKLISIHQESVKKEFYVTNEFFKNKYPPFINGITRYTIEVREVDTWKEYKEDKNSTKNIYKKIIPFIGG